MPSSRTILIQVKESGASVTISREWVQSRWEVVIRINGQERSRHGYSTIREAVDAMADRARMYVLDQA